MFSTNLTRRFNLGLALLLLAGSTARASSFCGLQQRLDQAQQSLQAAKLRLAQLGPNPTPSVATITARTEITVLQARITASRTQRDSIQVSVDKLNKERDAKFKVIDKELASLGSSPANQKRRAELERIKMEAYPALNTLKLQLSVLDAAIKKLAMDVKTKQAGLQKLINQDIRTDSLWQLDKRSRERQVAAAQQALNAAKLALKNGTIAKNSRLKEVMSKARLDTLKKRRDELKSRVLKSVRSKLRSQRKSWESKVTGLKAKKSVRIKLSSLLRRYFKQVTTRDYQRQVVRAYLKKAKELRNLSRSLDPFKCDLFVDVKDYVVRLDRAVALFTKWARERNGKARQAAAEAERLANEFNRRYRQARRERFKPSKNEGKVSSRSVKITVSDSNRIIDDEYKLYINGKFKGYVRNIQGGSTSFFAKLKSGRNVVELRLHKTRGRSTHLTIQINGREFRRSFSGSKDHRWTINAPA